LPGVITNEAESEMAKLNYTTVGSNKLDEAKVFYDSLLGSIGMKPMFEHPSGGRLYRGEPGLFGVLGPHDKQEATIGNGTMTGFGFDTREEVDAFHAKAVALGGTCDGRPGERAPTAYFAYFRDLDGNKLCGYKFG
jgi:catechol 2,3-dioxygenase-like lactoylglutathione lyase family enzyme